MAMNPDEIVVAPTGQLFLAPVGTAPPADTSTAWAAAWVDLGYLSEDAVTVSAESEETEIMAWQSSYAVWSDVRVGYTVQFQLMQWNEDTLLFAFGGGTYTAGTGKYEAPARAQYDPQAIGIEIVDGSKVRRVVYHRVKVNELGDIVFKGDEAALLDVTVKVLDNAGAAPFTLIGFADLAALAASTSKQQSKAA
jgi:hypothetical protein